MVDNLARELHRKNKCELAFCATENHKVLFHALEYVENDPELNRVPFLASAKLSRVYGFLGRFLWELQIKDHPTLSVRVKRRALARFLRAVENSRRPLSAHSLKGWDVFHSSYYGLPEATLHIPRLQRFLTVCDVSNILHPGLAERGDEFMLSVLNTLRPSDHVIAISQTTKDELCAVRPDLDPAQISVVPLAASDQFCPVPRSEEVDRVLHSHGLMGKRYFLSVCTLDKRKNLLTLLKAFSLWVGQERDKETQLALVGFPGNQSGKLKQFIQEHSLLRGRVQVLGFVPDAELPALYSNALGFVYPSIHEGFGLPVLEAMQSGLPVITSNVGALRELSRGAALLVDPHSVDEIAGALGELSQSEEVRTTLSEQGRARSQFYSWGRSAALLLEAYQRAT
jgi:glycosyltransferase involved in cell wall biosynthesis